MICAQEGLAMRRLPDGITEQELERVRKMTPGERLSEGLRLTREYLGWLMQQPKDVIDAFFENERRENDLRNEAILRCLERCRAAEESDVEDTNLTAS
jgi:hypothetical protein